MGIALITNNILSDSGTAVAGLVPTSRTISTTAPLTGGGDLSADRTIAIPAATSAVNGYLTSADWTTFNAKQVAGNYIVSLTGEATATGPGASAVTLNNASVTGKVLTGVNITGGTVLATDTMLTAFGKLQNQINGLIGSTIYQGVWNASTNTPTLTSSVGTNGFYYIVNVAGSTNLNGITDWKIGDWAIFNGGVWQKVDNTDAVTSVNGFTGAVSLTTDNIAEGVTNLYFLNSRARSALSFAAGSGAYNSTTGVITIPTNNTQITNGAGYITLSSLSAGAGISYNNTTGVIASTITQYTDALARAAISLTVTGASGASTYNNTTGVLNVPTYTLAGLGGQPLATNLTSLSGLTFASTSFVKMTAAGTFALDTSVYYLASNPSGFTSNVGTVTSVGLSSATSGVTIGSTPITTSGTITLAIATASGTQQGLLSSTDWTTFNNKQAALTNPVTGTGTTNYLPKFTGASTIGNSAIIDDGTTVSLIARALSGTSATFSSLSLSNTDGYLGTINSSGANGGYFEWRTSGTTIADIGTAQQIFGSGGSTNFGINARGARSLIFGTNNTARFTLDSGGAATFSSSVTATTGLTVGSLGSGSDAVITLATNASGSPRSIYYKASTATINFTQTGGADLMTLTNGGNLGIGTTAPGFALDVHSGTAGSMANFNTTRTGGGGISMANSGSVRLYLGQANWLGLDGIASNNNAISLSSGQAADIIFATNVANASNGERMRITSAGNVGIGTTSPDSLLHLEGASPFLRIKGTGSGEFGLKITDGSGSTFLGGLTYNSITGEQRLNGNQSYIYQTFYSGGSERMRITSGGNVLIGTTTDATGKLQVNGSVYATSFFESSSVAFKNILATNPITSLNVDVIKYKRTNVDVDDVRFGYSAEQINSLMPELTNKEATAVKYLDVHTLLIAELQREIKELKAKLN